jgi:hypothetical protein
LASVDHETGMRRKFVMRSIAHSLRKAVLGTLTILTPFAVLLSQANAATPSPPRQAEVLRAGCDALAGEAASIPGDGPMFLQSYPAIAGQPVIPALQNAAFVYDNALASIAFVACGKPGAARRIADAFVMAGTHDRHYHDGRLRNAYRAGALTHDPIEMPGWWDTQAQRWNEDAYQVGSATGNVAWAALALMTVYEATQDRRYLDAASSLMNWIATRTYDAGPPGGFIGGYFGEEPQPLRQSWKSTEQNVDTYAAFSWLARSTGDGRWAIQAAHARDFVAAMWDPREGRFAIGTRNDGRTLNTGPSAIDAELWPLIALPDSSASGWERAIDWTVQHHRTGAGYGFNAQPDGVWTEGTGQAALVLKAKGRSKDAAPLWDLLLNQRAPSGLLYATPNERIRTGLAIGPTSESADFYYFHMPHLGATAWAVLAAADWNPFVGRRLGP